MYFPVCVPYTPIDCFQLAILFPLRPQFTAFCFVFILAPPLVAATPIRSSYPYRNPIRHRRSLSASSYLAKFLP